MKKSLNDNKLLEVTLHDGKRGYVRPEEVKGLVPDKETGKWRVLINGTTLLVDEVSARAVIDTINTVSDAPTLAAIPGYGQHMLWDTFVENVKSTMFTNYDGYAEFATSDGVSGIVVTPSDVKHARRPAWATHVVWYNK